MRAAHPLGRGALGEQVELQAGGMGGLTRIPRKGKDNPIGFTVPDRGLGMGILDEAIREHLELKRAHGAAEDELQKLEDEAFGPAERPSQEQPAVDPFAEAPTQFMAAPETGSSTRAEVETPPPFPRANIADLQEAPPEPGDAEATADAEPEPVQDAADEAASETAEPHEAEMPGDEAGAGPSTEERHAIASQPTELYDVEGELADELPAPADEHPHEESGAPDSGEEGDDDDFFDEQRLSDELDQALEAPLADDEETDEDFWGGGRSGREGEHELFEERQEPEPEDAEPEAEDHYDDEGVDEDDDEEPSEERTARRDAPEDDVLEDTPDFLEDAPEDDQLWFEQKPPKDFDFDD